jgi:hypothetical protein
MGVMARYCLGATECMEVVARNAKAAPIPATPIVDATPHRATPHSKQLMLLNVPGHPSNLPKLPATYLFRHVKELAGEIRRGPPSHVPSHQGHHPLGATSLASPLIRSIMASFVIPQQQLKLLPALPPRCEDHKKVELAGQGSYKMQADLILPIHCGKFLRPCVSLPLLLLPSWPALSYLPNS